MSIVFFSSSIVLQVAFADILSTVMLAYLIVVRPMVDRLNNFIQIFNELAVLVCVWSMFHFTLFVGDAETRYELATNYLGFIAFNVGINILIFLFFIVKKIYSACKSMCVKRRAKRQAKNRVAEKLKK